MSDTDRLTRLEAKLDAIGTVLANLARCLVVADHAGVEGRDARLDASIVALAELVSSPYQPVVPKG